MKEEALTDALLRQFLLGQVDDEAQQRIESLFVIDSLVRERVLAAEEDLLEDYLEGSLTGAERDRFLSVYGDTAVQQRRLRVAETIRQWARNETHENQPRMATTSVWSRLRSRLSFKPVILIPIAVSATIAVIFAAVWINNSLQRNRQQLAIEQEVARLNTRTSLREISPQVALTLPPVAVRGSDGSEITRSQDLQFGELRLILLHKEQYPRYRAVVRRLGDDLSITTPDLQVETPRDLEGQRVGGRVVRLRLPASMLTRGTYQVQLNGIAADGSPSPVEEYRFTVIN